MSEKIRVLCPECGDVVSHHCHSNLKRAAYDLLSWVPEGFATEKLEKAVMAAGRETGWIEKSDKAEDQFKHPFFGSQAWSYPLFGSKDTARSFHAYLHNFIRAAGLDPEAIMSEIHKATQRKEAAEKEHLAGTQKRKDERAALIAYLQGEAPLEERIVKLDEILRLRSRGLTPFASSKEDEDRGFHRLHKVLDTYYGGGINHTINRARISKLENEAYEALQENKP